MIRLDVIAVGLTGRHMARGDLNEIGAAAEAKDDLFPDALTCPSYQGIIP